MLSNICIYIYCICVYIYCIYVYIYIYIYCMCIYILYIYVYIYCMCIYILYIYMFVCVCVCVFMGSETVSEQFGTLLLPVHVATLAQHYSPRPSLPTTGQHQATILQMPHTISFQHFLSNSLRSQIVSNDVSLRIVHTPPAIDARSCP